MEILKWESTIAAVGDISYGSLINLSECNIDKILKGVRDEKRILESNHLEITFRDTTVTTKRVSNRVNSTPKIFRSSRATTFFHLAHKHQQAMGNESISFRYFVSFRGILTKYIHRWFFGFTILLEFVRTKVNNTPCLEIRQVTKLFAYEMVGFLSWHLLATISRQINYYL